MVMHNDVTKMLRKCIITIRGISKHTLELIVFKCTYYVYDEYLRVDAIIII